MENGKFKYFKSDNIKDMQNPNGVLNMDLYSVSVHLSSRKHDGRGLVIKILGNDHYLEFRAKDKQSC